MSWRLEAAGPDGITPAQAATLQAAVVAALNAGFAFTEVYFSSSDPLLRPVTGSLVPPMLASVQRQAVADGTHTAVRN